MWERQLCRHQGQWRRRRGRCSRHWSREFSPAARDEDHGEAGCPPAVHGGPWCSRYPPVTHGSDPTPKQVWLKEAVTPWGARAGAGSCQDLQTHGERSTHQSSLLAGLVTVWGTQAGAGCSWRTAPYGKNPYWGSSWRAAPHGKDSRWRSLWELSSVRGTSHWSRRVSVFPLRRKEQQSQRVMNWLQPQLPNPLHCSGGRRQRNRSEDEPRKKGVVGGRCFKI